MDRRNSVVNQFYYIGNLLEGNRLSAAIRLLITPTEVGRIVVEQAIKPMC